MMRHSPDGVDGKDHKYDKSWPCSYNSIHPEISGTIFWSKYKQDLLWRHNYYSNISGAIFWSKQKVHCDVIIIIYWGHLLKETKNLLWRHNWY